MEEVGLEPTKSCGRGVYSPVQLPLCDSSKLNLILGQGIEPRICESKSHDIPIYLSENMCDKKVR